MKKLLIAIGVLCVTLLLHSTPSYAAASEQINQFDSQIHVSKDNKITITETITYDYGDIPKHGIYRDVPVDYHDGSLNYYLNFNLVSALSGDNQLVETKIVTENGNKRIRIGDPDVTISGVHIYTLTYELYPVIIEKDSKPFLNLDIVGEGWQVPIYNITAKITLDDNAQLTNVSWYGANNQTTELATASVYRISAYSGFTVNATLPDGYVSQYLKPNVMRSEDVAAMLIGILIGVVCGVITLFVIVVVLIRKIRTHNRRRKQIVVAQYDPPVNMSPAHIGLLEDDTTSNREITATIINWAVLGYIKIVFIPRQGLFRPKDYQLVRLKHPDDLPAHELSLFNAFFSGAAEVMLSKINRTTVAAQIISFNSILKAGLSDRGYYDKNGQLLMRGTLTEEGAKQWALVDGFKLYLGVVEKDRLKFTDAPDKTPERFNKLLPYAIALGVEKEWAKQFEGINLTESTNWYAGNLATFSAVALVSDLGSSFASTVDSNSSVSSSGGSSGGGFGGGGGGSW